MAEMLQFMVSINALFTGSNEFSKSALMMSKVQSAMQRLQTTAGKISSYKRQLQNIERLSKDLERTSQEYKALSSSMTANGELTDSQNAKLDREHEKLKRKEDALEAQKRKLDEMGSALRDAGINMERLGEAEDELTKKTSKLAEAQNKFASIKGQLTWGNIKGDIMKAAGTAMMFKQPVQVSANFNQAMAQVRAVTNANDTDFQMLSDQAKYLGSTTQFTSMQAANTQENLARAGLTPKEIRDMMPSVLAMAAADGMDLAQAGEIMAGSIKGYGLQSSQSTQIADMLAYISANSRTDVAKAGAAFQSISGTGQMMGIEADRMGAYIGAYANRGITGEEAATSIERSLQLLAAPTEQALKTLKKYNVTRRTEKGNLRYLEDIVTELYTNTEKYGATKQIEAFKSIFGKQYAGDMQKLALEVKSGGFAKMYEGLRIREDGMSQSSGTAQKMANIRNNTLMGDITALSSAWEGLMERIGTAIEPINRYIVQTIANGITKITEFMKKHETLAEVLTNVVYVAAGLKVFAVGYKYMKLTVGFFSAWRELSAIMGTVTKASKLMTAAQWLYNAALNANPVGLFITGLAGIIAFGTLIYKNWERIKKAWQGLIEWWNNLDLKNIWQSVIDGFDSMCSYLRETWEDVCNFLNSLNPFNWEMPSWLSGGAKIAPEQAKVMVEGTKQKYGTLDFRPSYMQQATPHASGGILTRPHLGLVAEAGPEAIIPLRDKSRGREVLSQAANILGMSAINTSVTNSTSSQSSQSSQNITSIASAIGAEPHAFGGIMTRPHIGLVAEAGPEAIIPLRDKSRGREVLAQAANMLGMSSVMDIANSTSVIDMAGNIAQTAGNITGDTRISRTARTITNSIANSTDILDMAGNIASSTSTNSNTRDIISMAKTIFSNRSEESYDRNYAAGNSSYSRNDSRTSNSSSILGQPQINITVNASNNNDSQGLAAMIAAKVQEAWQELQERQARLAYA